MLDFLWLLLPVAAAGGWFAGRRNRDSGEEDAFWGYASNYHQGLNYLLNEQQDRAVDLFVSSNDVDRDTAETHLALGNMYRRRGEVDSAIRIHQSVVDKDQLSDSIRSDALLELARDYDSAGLLDRSEKHFRELIRQNRHLDSAFENLLLIFERARDWPRAITTAEEYRQHAGTDLQSRVAHYYCEIADEHRREQRLEEAEQSLQQALSASASCARANIMLADIAIGRGEFATAIAKFEIVENTRPELMPEIISPLFSALERSGDEQRLRDYINRIRTRFNAYSVIRTTRSMIEQLDGIESADDFFKEQIVKRPSLRGLRDWARGQLAKSPPGERDKVGVMCDMLDQVVKDMPGYVCEECGFSGQSLHWRCPGCGSWDTVHTVIGAEGE